MMRNLLFSLLVLVTLGMNAQNSVTLDIDEKGWVRTHTEMSEDEYWNRFREETALQTTEEFILVDELSSKGWVHKKFQHFVEGIPVLGDVHILHIKDGVVDHANGKLHPVNTYARPLISEDQALTLAQKLYPNHLWIEDRVSAQLVIAGDQYPLPSSTLNTSYLIELNSINPIGRYRIIIDATSGRVVMNVDIKATCSNHTDHICDHHGFKAEKTEDLTGGVMPTLYHDIQDVPIEYDSEVGNYVLRSTSDEGVIMTYKSDTTHFESSTGTFFETDTAYLNGAVDAHWSIERTRTYFSNTFVRDGITGDGDTIFSYIFPLEMNFNNAYWDGEAMYYGAGDKEEYGPFTSIDICAHEYTHGVTEYSAGLEYTYESGALNESISDIIGKAVEHTYLPSTFSWELGERINLAEEPEPRMGFRSMENPNNFGHPKFYKGRWWWNNRFDNGGVHINSGVLNYWFYLLCEGGAGDNENGDGFDVKALGFLEAQDLIYGMLTLYLTPTSQYIDARDASIEVVKLSYPGDMDRLNSVLQAWLAVGLGFPLTDMDLGVTAYNFNTTFCEKNGLYPKAEIFNLSESDILQTGDTITLSYSYKNGPKVFEDWELENDLSPGEKLEYEFETAIYDSVEGSYPLVVELEVEWDSVTYNNTSEVEVTWTSGLDFEVELFQSNDPRDACSRVENSTIFFAGEYNGCTPISSQDSFLMTVMMNGDTISEYINPLRTVYPGAFVLFGDFEFTDLPLGQNRAIIRFDHPRDPVGKNNEIQIDFYRINSISTTYNEDFESAALVDSSLISLGAGYYNRHSIQEVDGETCLVLGGLGILDEDGDLILDTNTVRLATFMLANMPFTNDLKWCVNTSGFIRPKLEFEVMRQVGDFDYPSYGTRSSLATGVEVGYAGVSNGTPGFVEYLVDLPYDTFVIKSYDLPIRDESFQLRLQNLVLTSVFDPITGEITSEGDRVVYNYIKIYDEALSNGDSDENYSLEVFPNPTSRFVEIKKDAGQLERGTYMIFTSDGVMVESQKLTQEQSKITFDLGYTKGSYIMLFQSENGVSRALQFIQQ